MDDQPLQLVDFSQEDDGGSKELLLNHKNLDSVLEQAKDRPIAVISICGPTRQGKSFLLGYVVRYLEALENDDDGWMDWDNKTKPLDAFKFKGGVSPVTQGILIWSRPFFITNEDGVDIAVVLIDTQGTNSEYTTTRDMSVIAGLSLLTSSVVIFNFFTHLQEDVLAALNTYTQFGMLAMDQMKGDESPFQKLIFLIRDWNNPGEFPYGAKGGKSFLQEKLTVKDGQPTDAQQVRKSIKKCFEKLDCYLMPPIGDKALGPDFEGSIAELNRPFALKLEDFINTMLNGLTLPIKKVLGNEITAPELTSCFEKYVEIFNSDQVPTAETMLLATSRMANRNIIEKALKSYREYMNRRAPKGKKDTNIPKETLARFHTAAEKQALTIFKKAPAVGTPETADELREELKSKLKSQFSQIVQQNEDKRRQFVTAATNEATTNFREQLETVIQLEDAADTKFYEDSLINKTAKDVQADIMDEFYEKFPNEEEDALNAIVQSLESIFESILYSYLTKNKNHRANAEQAMNKIVEDLHSKFQFKAQEYFATNKFEDNDATLDQACQDFKGAQSRSFLEAKKPGKREFYNEYLSRLGNEMDSTFAHLKNQHKLGIHSLVQEAETFLSKNISEYETELRGVAQAGGMNEAALRMIHSMKVSSILDKFYRDSPFPRSSAASIELETRLNEQLKQVLDSVVTDEVKVKKEQAERSFESARLESLELYDKEMKSLFKEIDFIPVEKLEREHERLQREALQNYENFPKIGTSENNQEIKNEIKSTITTNFESIKNRNEQGRLTAEAEAKKIVQTCEDQYDQIMTTDLDFSREEELRAHHEKATEKVIQSLWDAFSIWDASFSQAFEESLKYDIEEKYQELKEALDIKTTEEEVKLGSLLVEAKKNYNEEMEKHFKNNEFMNPANLLDIHDQVKEVVISKIDKTTAITKSQKEGLHKELGELLGKYMDKNYMNANSEQGLGVAPAIGIDLGTTYCCVAVYYRGRVHIVTNREQGGDKTTPSYVSYDPVDGSETYGKPAKENAYKNPEFTIYDAKRILGRKMTDKELQEDMQFWPFTVKEDEGGAPKVVVNNGKLIHPEQVSAKLLTEFRKMAENFLNLEPGTIKKAVITIPAYFNDGQRQATLDAGELAGLEVLTILTEPTAAAISYSMERLDNKARKIVVYDLGGGTFDVAILDMKPKKIDVLGLNGDTHLGGEDFDKNMMTHCAECFKADTGIDLFAGKDSNVKSERDDARRRLRRLQTYCENAKRDLATARKTKITVDGLADGKDLSVDITREKFEELNEAYFQKSIDLVGETLAQVGLQKQDIDDIVLVGGSSRIPRVQQLLEKFFEGKALNRSIHPDHAVAYGAAVQAAILNGEDAKGKIDFEQIQDVTPMSLGVEVASKELSVIVPKNSKIPIKKKQVYYTVRDNQPTIDVQIYQGEDITKAANNKKLGDFQLTGIPPKKQGEEPIDIWMSINSMGILHVEAVVRSVNISNSIVVVEKKGRMSSETKKQLLAEGTDP